MKTLTQKDKDRILLSADRIVKEKRRVERAKALPPGEVNDSFHDQIEQYALDNKCSFQKALAPMAVKFPAEFGEYRRRVRAALMSDQEKKEVAAKLSSRLFGTVEFAELKRLELFVKEIMTGEGCDQNHAIQIMSKDDPRAFGRYRKLKNMMVGN